LAVVAAAEQAAKNSILTRPAMLLAMLQASILAHLELNKKVFDKAESTGVAQVLLLGVTDDERRSTLKTLMAAGISKEEANKQAIGKELFLAINPIAAATEITENSLMRNEANSDERIDNKTVLLVVPVQKAGDIDTLLGQRAGNKDVRPAAVTLDTGKESGLVPLTIDGENAGKEIVDMPVMDEKGNFQRDESGNTRTTGILVKAGVRGMLDERTGKKMFVLYMSPADDSGALQDEDAREMIAAITAALDKIKDDQPISDTEKILLDEFLARAAVMGIINETVQNGVYKKPLEELGLGTTWKVEADDDILKTMRKLSIDRDGPYGTTVFGKLDEAKTGKDYQEDANNFAAKVRDGRQ
jgi:hypothetical protein